MLLCVLECICWLASLEVCRLSELGTIFLQDLFASGFVMEQPVVVVASSMARVSCTVCMVCAERSETAVLRNREISRNPARSAAPSSNLAGIHGFISIV